MANYSAGGQTLLCVDAACVCANSSVPRQNQYQYNVILGSASVGYFGNPRPNRIIFSVVRNVALLGSHRPLWPMGKENVVCCLALWFLVGKLPVLFLRVSSPGI